jgi:hypothetical protein
MSLSLYMLQRLEEHLDVWRKSLITLPDGYLRTERRDLGDDAVGARRLVADMLDAEIDRRRKAGELAL